MSKTTKPLLVLSFLFPHYCNSHLSTFFSVFSKQFAQLISCHQLCVSAIQALQYIHVMWSKCYSCSFTALAKRYRHLLLSHACNKDDLDLLLWP